MIFPNSLISSTDLAWRHASDPLSSDNCLRAIASHRLSRHIRAPENPAGHTEHQPDGWIHSPLRSLML
jgi:hypothetical protein